MKRKLEECIFRRRVRDVHLVKPGPTFFFFNIYVGEEGEQGWGEELSSSNLRRLICTDVSLT